MMYIYAPGRGIFPSQTWTQVAHEKASIIKACSATAGNADTARPLDGLCLCQALIDVEDQYRALPLQQWHILIPTLRLTARPVPSYALAWKLLYILGILYNRDTPCRATRRFFRLGSPTSQKLIGLRKPCSRIGRARRKMLPTWSIKSSTLGRYHNN